MSFIRCTSNPEGMYVYHHVDGYISMSTSPFNFEKELKIPPRNFYHVCKRYDKYGFNQVKYGDFEVREVQIYEKSGEIIKKEIDFLHERKKIGYRMAIIWKGEIKFLLWRVTWDYIARYAIISHNCGKKKGK